MTIGEVIRKYRKEKGLTQEELAVRLGVTAPAVNKWENNNTLPDIGLLAPIARLLDISTDTLLSYKDNLSEEEINAFIKRLDEQSSFMSFAELFEEAKKKIQEYPNCEKLKWNTAIMLESWKLIHDVPDGDEYDQQICTWYLQLLDSEDQQIKKAAADSLFHFYYRKEQYEKAETYLSYFSEDDPDKKRLQADICKKTNRKEEAYRAYEELMLFYLNHLRITLNALQVLCMEDRNMDMAHKFVDIQSGLAALFEMGIYQENAIGLDLAAFEKNADETARIMKIILENSDTVADFMKSGLFSHLPEHNTNSSFLKQLKSDLLKGFQDEETFGYMRGNEYWEKLREL